MSDRINRKTPLLPFPPRYMNMGPMPPPPMPIRGVPQPPQLGAPYPAIGIPLPHPVMQVPFHREMPGPIPAPVHPPCPRMPPYGPPPQFPPNIPMEVPPDQQWYQDDMWDNFSDDQFSRYRGVPLYLPATEQDRFLARFIDPITGIPFVPAHYFQNLEFFDVYPVYFCSQCPGGASPPVFFRNNP